MKIYAHYDSEGNINSLIVSNAPKGIEVMLSPQPGLYAGEIEGLKVKDEQDEDALREIAESYRIANPHPRLKLTKKS
ncbi:MAG TPA: hypothetical protein VK892_16270 [Pyrinomonadaceae bacterium]|nr:hypothetical protein [Pyrinomonadaceae bacterium]